MHMGVKEGSLTVSEIQTGVDFRHSITVHPNSSYFRHCLKYEQKVWLSDTNFFNRCLKSELFVRIADTFV